jgi:hypothetical protein
MFAWAEVLGAAWPLVRCRLGLHKWKQVRRYEPKGFPVEFLGISGIAHWRHAGERCARCGKFVRYRKPWWKWVAQAIAWGSFPAFVIGICTLSGMWWVLCVFIALVVVMTSILVALS